MELGALVKKRKNEEVQPRIEAPELSRQFDESENEESNEDLAKKELAVGYHFVGIEKDQ